jgi:hypothetical protein
MRWSRTPRPCYCTSPKGYWCTRTDRHAEHEAVGGSGTVYSRWHGDFPNESEFLETFSTEEGFRTAGGNDVLEQLSAVDHNDLIKGID